METKTAIKSIIKICFFVIPFLLTGQENKQIFIKANISDTIVLNENYCEKIVKDDQITFSIGLSTLGEINKFIFKNRTDRKKQISKQQYESLNISSIKELNKILYEKKMIKYPNKIFKDIFIVEIQEGSINLYKVYWEKIFFDE